MCPESPENVAPLKIGAVAQRSGLSVQTLRYYEDLGLLAPTVSRSDHNYRLFSPQVFSRLDFIRRSQTLGLSLQDIKEILQVHDGGTLPCGVVKNHLQEKLAHLQRQIQALETQKQEIQRLISQWQDFPSAIAEKERICPNLQPPNQKKSPHPWGIDGDQGAIAVKH